MSPISRPLSVLVALGLAACASSSNEPMAAPAPAAAAAAPAPSGGGGALISAAQVSRGRDQFRSMCTECHTAAEFGDATFKAKWSRRTVGDLFSFVSNNMPDDAPGILTPNQAIDIVTYFLSMNGFETGSATMDPDQAELDAISLSRIRSE